MVVVHETCYQPRRRVVVVVDVMVVVVEPAASLSRSQNHTRPRPVTPMDQKLHFPACLPHLSSEDGGQHGQEDVEDGGGTEGRVDHHQPLQHARVVLGQRLAAEGIEEGRRRSTGVGQPARAGEEREEGAAVVVGFLHLHTRASPEVGRGEEDRPGGREEAPGQTDREQQPHHRARGGREEEEEEEGGWRCRVLLLTVRKSRLVAFMSEKFFMSITTMYVS